MRTKPAPQQRPKPFHGIHMDFTKAIAIFISGVLASSMVDALMVVSPRTQASINAVFVRINKCPWSNGLFDERLDGLLLHIGHHLDHHLTAPLNHPKDGRPLFLQCASATFSFESASTSFAPFGLHHLRLSCMASNHIRFVALHLV